MKLSSGQYNIRNNQMDFKKHPVKLPSANKISFTSLDASDVLKATKSVFKKADNVFSITNATKVVDSIDDILGDKYFTAQLQKAGIELKDDLLQIPDRTFLKDDLGRTLLFPIKDLIPGVAQKISNKTGKQFKQGSFVQNLIDEKEKEAARNWVLDALEEYSKLRKKGEKEIDIDKFSENFQSKVSSYIIKPKKGYATRDERTLNRIVTSIVSAFYSASDFYNISMLENDNKDEALNSGKGRLKQEFTRMAANATATFVALGAFDRHTKQNIFLNALVIAGGALFAEVTSRLISKTPLRPLSPEEAEKISHLRKQKQAQKNQQQNVQHNSKVQFKANLKPENQLYRDFVSKDGSISALKLQEQQIAKENIKAIPQEENEPKKKWGMKKVLSTAFGMATLYFFAAKLLKGDYSAQKSKKLFMEKYAGVNFKDMSAEALEEMKNIVSKHNDTTKKVSFFANFKDKLVYNSNYEVDLNKLIDNLNNLKAQPEAAGLSTLIDKYLSDIQKCIDGNCADENNVMLSKVERLGVDGFVSGFTKIFKTIYEILAVPAKFFISPFIDKQILDKNDAVAKFDKLARNISKKYPKDELTELHRLFEKEAGNTQEIVDKIKSRTRNVQITQETGDLANLSRTMVTAIGTYFFVNDYRNRVLIESEGKNVQGAKEEMNERIWHKVFNFIINGTLMNIFNTTFSKTVNGTLLGAATVATATELTNEFLVRKSICQPVLPQKSKQDIIDFELAQMDKKGIWGAWSRTFKKITGKKSLTQKAGVDIKNIQNNNKELNKKA